MTTELSSYSVGVNSDGEILLSITSKAASVTLALDVDNVTKLIRLLEASITTNSEEW